MRVIGLIGGCSFEASAIYYRRLNEEARRRYPGHGARILMWSFDFAEIDALLAEDRWDEIAARFIEAARWLERGGAECVLICTNTIHRIAGKVAAQISVPLIHIADASADAAKALGLRRALLLGTKYFQAHPAFAARLAACGVTAVRPYEADIACVHQVIYEDLMRGVVSDESRRRLLDVIDRARRTQDFDFVLLACTELGMALQPGTLDLPIIDTVEAHVAAAAVFAFIG